MPIIWLDGLDGPLIQSLNILFFEMLDKEAQSITRKEGESLRQWGFARPPKASGEARSAEPFRYGWQESYEALKAIHEENSVAIVKQVLNTSGDIEGAVLRAASTCPCWRRATPGKR